VWAKMSLPEKQSHINPTHQANQANFRQYGTYSRPLLGLAWSWLGLLAAYDLCWLVFPATTS
jgi:hypothetical protein